MSKGIYRHKPTQGYQKGNKINVGRKHSSETIEKMRKAKIGNKAWLGKKHSLETRRKMSVWQIGRRLPEETKRKISLAKKGKLLSIEHRKKISIAHKLFPENHWNWRGGLSPVNYKIRHSFEYRLWREAVFKRDDWSCVFCGQRGGDMEVDHIKPFADYPELRFAIDNGRTLCKNCHKKTDTYAKNLK